MDQINTLQELKANELVKILTLCQHPALLQKRAHFLLWIKALIWLLGKMEV